MSYPNGDDVGDLLRRGAASMRPDPGALDKTMARVRRREHRRRVGAGVLSLAIVIGSGTLMLRAFSGSEEDTRTAAATATDAGAATSPSPLPPGWRRCRNPAVGYSIGYPREWFTTDTGNWTGPGEPPADVPELRCHYFDPDPFSVELSPATDAGDTDGIDHQADRMVAIHATVSRESFDDSVRRLRGGRRWTILRETPLIIGEREAVRFLYQEGERVWDLFVVDLSERGSLWFSIAKRSPSDPDVATRYPHTMAVGESMLESFHLQ